MTDMPNRYISVTFHCKWVQFKAGVTDFSLLQNIRNESGIQPPVQLVQAILSQETKQPGCEADHSGPSIAEVMNKWIYAPIPPTCLQGLHSKNFPLPSLLQTHQKLHSSFMHMSQHIALRQL
jgi:hypothetical protein